VKNFGIIGRSGLLLLMRVRNSSNGWPPWAQTRHASRPRRLPNWSPPI